MTREVLRSLEIFENFEKNIVIVETNRDLLKEPWFDGDAAHLYFPNMIFGYNRFLKIGFDFLSMPAEYFLCLNNDVILFPGALESLTKALDYFDVVSAKSNITEVQKNFSGIVRGFEAGKTFSGWAWLCKTDLFFEIPFEVCFPPEFFFWYQDNYFMEVLKKHGKTQALICDARIDHLESRSHNLISEEKRKELTDGQKIVYDRKLKELWNSPK